MTYTLTGDILKQDATLTKIKNLKVDYRYQQHLDSLESYPILPGSVWPKKEGLVEGKDFEIVSATELWRRQGRSDMKGDHYLAVPLSSVSLREEPQERVWKELREQQYEEDMDMDQFLDYLERNYNISKK